VGVGTTSPNGKLHVAGTNGQLRISGSGYVVNPAEMTLGQYTSTLGYLQVPGGSTGEIQIWNGGSSGVVAFNNYGIGLGGVSPSSGAGIRFPATQSASSDANTLDDYEEGTWTPTDASGAGLSLSNTSGNCFYTKVGRTVTVSFRLTYPSTASGSVAVIGGLPFLSANTTVNNQSLCFGEQNFSAGAMGVLNYNAASFLFLTTNGSSVTVHTNANVSTKDFRGSATYQATS
jgi:hypothetical protein